MGTPAFAATVLEGILAMAAMGVAVVTQARPGSGPQAPDADDSVRSGFGSRLANLSAGKTIDGKKWQTSWPWGDRDCHSIWSVFTNQASEFC